MVDERWACQESDVGRVWSLMNRKGIKFNIETSFHIFKVNCFCLNYLVGLFIIIEIIIIRLDIYNNMRVQWFEFQFDSLIF